MPLGHSRIFLLASACILAGAYLFASGRDPSPKSTARKACRRLLESLDDSKVKSSGLEYDASAKGAWSVLNQLDEPTCIVFPQNTTDVVVASQVIFHSDAHYAVRGGGHSAMPGWNNIEDGVLIDLSRMKAFSYDPRRDVIDIEPGVLWREVHDGLAKDGVAPVGGRMSDVGISGFLLGGGLSFLSPAYGFGCDSFQSLDVVLPSGKIVTATRSNQYSDLFRALKGGGSRFGIVTKFTVDAIHTGTNDDKTWYGGSVLYPNSSSLPTLTALDHFITENTDPKAALLTSISYGQFTGNFSTLALTVLLYNGTEAQFRDAFSEFLVIPAEVSNFGPLSYNDITKILPAGSERTNVNLYGASTLYPGKGLFQDAFIHWSNFSNTFKDEIFFSTLGITPVRQNQIDVSNAKGGTAFNPPNGPFAYIQMANTFPAGVTSVSPEIRKGLDLLFKQVPQSPGLPLYLNESDEKQDVFKSYGWFQQLKKTYAKYDPTTFNVRRLVGPKGL